MIYNNKFNAFTLSEVLITLVIIGVIAAITIPAISANVEHKKYVAALNKAYSSLSQAYINIIKEEGTAPIFLCEINQTKCFGDFFAKELKFTKTKEFIPNNEKVEDCWEDNNIQNPNERHFCAITADGIVYDFDYEYGSQEKNKHAAIISIDINGSRKPNVWGKDRYSFFIWNSDGYRINVLPNELSGFQKVCSFGKNNYSYANTSCAWEYLYNK